MQSLPFAAQSCIVWAIIQMNRTWHWMDEKSTPWAAVAECARVFHSKKWWLNERTKRTFLQFSPTEFEGLNECSTNKHICVLLRTQQFFCLFFVCFWQWTSIFVPTQIHAKSLNFERFDVCTMKWRNAEKKYEKNIKRILRIANNICCW